MKLMRKFIDNERTHMVITKKMAKNLLRELFLLGLTN